MRNRITHLTIAIFFTALATVIAPTLGAQPTAADKPVAVITGSSFGLGKELVERSVEQGWRVALVDFRPEPSEQLVAEITASGGEAVFFDVDLSQPEQRIGLIAKVVQQYGRVDYLFNNAGYAYLATLEQMEATDAKRLFEVNYWAYADLAQQVIPVMRQQQSGVILNVSSILGMYPAPPGYGHYAATKHALHGLFQTVTKEVADDNIKVFLAAPAGMKTNIGKHSVGPQSHPNAELPSHWEAPGIIADDIFMAIEGESKVFNPGAAGRKSSD